MSGLRQGVGAGAEKTRRRSGTGGSAEGSKLRTVPLGSQEASEGHTKDIPEPEAEPEGVRCPQQPPRSCTWPQRRPAGSCSL